MDVWERFNVFSKCEDVPVLEDHHLIFEPWAFVSFTMSWKIVYSQPRVLADKKWLKIEIINYHESMTVDASFC